MKKVYKAPQLKTEKIEIGVFGCYGSNGGGGNHGGGGRRPPMAPFIGFFNPLFGLCCGG